MCVIVGVWVCVCVCVRGGRCMFDRMSCACVYVGVCLRENVCNCVCVCV